MKKILLLLIACSSISLMGMKPAPLSMNDAPPAPAATTLHDELPIHTRATECCLKGFMIGILYPTYIACACAVEAAQCPQRAFNSNSHEQFFVTRVFCVMWLDSLRNGN